MLIGNFNDLKPGDLVSIMSPQGQVRKGKAVIINRPAGVVVLNCGGKYGTPACATASNFISASRKAGANSGGFWI